MLNGWKEIILLIGIIGLLGLVLTSCTPSNATQTDQRGNSKTNASASPGAEVGKSNMNMPATPTATKKMKVASVANQVVIENFSFAPATLTVKPGTKVTWINRDDVPHTVDENDKRFKSGTMDTDDQYSYTFSSPGTFSYFCALHPKMTGQIIVE
jgi:plastocyanin